MPRLTDLLSLRPLALAVLATAVPACGGDGGDNNPDLPFGETAIVVVVNPVENEGNTAAPPAFVGADFAGLGVAADPGGTATTDATGLAVLTGLDPGVVQVSVGGVTGVPVDVTAEGNVYDLAVATDGTQIGAYPGFPIGYALGGTIVEIAPGADATVALDTDSTIVVFGEGVHSGNLVITGENVILYGEGFSGGQVVIDGSVEVRGGSVRIRGVTITGDLAVFGNNFGMSFSVVRGMAALNGQAISFLRNVFCQGATVPSSDAALFDNAGLAPIPVPAAVCTP